jgi:hypothetical protein
MAQAKEMLAGLKRFQEGGEVTDEASPDLAQALAVLEADPSKYKSMYQYLLTKGDIANLNDQNLAKEDVAALGLVHAARMSNTEPEAFIENIRPSLQNLPSRQQDVRPNVMLQGSSGGFNTRMPGMNFDMPFVPATLMGRVGAEADIGRDTVRAGLIGGGTYIPNMGVMPNPVMADVGYRTPLAGGTLDVGVSTGVQNPSMKNTNFMANYSRRFAEGGEVTDEFPEEAGVMPEQNPSEAAKRLLYYKKTAAPTPPTDLARLGKQAGLIGLGFAPGSGVADYFGKFPAVEGGTEPSAVENFQKGNYGTAALQGLGAMGDLAMAVPVAGAAIGSVMKAPRTAQRILSSSTTAKDDLAKMPKKLAPANESGFYSPTEAAALNLQRKSGPGQAFLNDIMKGENVKSDEIKAMGLDTFLKDKKNVTTAEVQDFIAQNKIKLGETVYGASLKLKPDELERLSYLVKENNKSPLGAIDDRLGEGTYTELIRLENIRDKSSVDSLYRQQKALELGAQQAKRAGDKAMANRLFTQANHMNARAEALDLQGAGIEKPTKFGNYALPGGENYREIVLTLPSENTAVLEAAQIKAGELRQQTSALMENYKDVSLANNPGDPAIVAAYQKVDESRKLRDKAEAEVDRIKKETKDKTYSSSHWDEPNALSHLRVSDRVTDGKKTLLVDEVQSDWHQAGRERGYAGELPKNWSVNEDDLLGWVVRNEDGEAIGSGSTKQEALNASTQGSSGRVPDAPYKDDWYQLTLRRAIKEAIDGGYDRVALPTGARVNERFDLSKQIESISHQKNPNGTYQIVATDKNNRHVMNETSVSAEKLSNIVGKDIAKKIIGEEGTPFPEQSVGAGMKKLSGLDLQIGGEGMKKYYDEIYPGYLQKFGKKYGADSGKTTVDVKGKPEPLFYMDITPKMREEFTSGIPMREGGEVRRYL